MVVMSTYKTLVWSCVSPSGLESYGIVTMAVGVVLTWVYLWLPKGVDDDIMCSVRTFGRVHTCSGSRSGPVPVPFHSFVLRSHLQKLTGPVPVAGLRRVHTCSGTRPERVRLHPPPPQHTRFLILGLFSSRRVTALMASRHRRRRSRIDGQIRLCMICSNSWLQRNFGRCIFL